MKGKYPGLEARDDLSAIIQSFSNSSQHLFVIGGKEIFYQTYFYADRLYISVIKEKYQGNVKLDFFPEMIKDFRLIKEQEFPQFLTRVYVKNKAQ
jgi:dihydrofolate reductase